MTDRTNGGSPVVNPQQYHTVPTAILTEAQQRDRYLSHGESQELSIFFGSGLKRLEIAETLTRHADKIVAAGANRIFIGGNPMSYLERPADPVGMPGSDYYVAEDYLSAVKRQKKAQAVNRDRPRSVDTSNGIMEWFKDIFTGGKPSVPSSFRAIDISRYGPVRMKRSMRDLSWFLRYITYAIVAGDTSIISVNTCGLRGVIPEDVTLATVVALREMQWKALTYFPQQSAAAGLVKQYFDVLINDYWVEKPPSQLRIGVSKHHAGLPLPQSYRDSAIAQPRWVMKPGLPDIEKGQVVRAAYRQVFERDVTATYEPQLSELVSQVKGGYWSMKEFIRQLGKSRLYRQLYYEPYTISRSIELACRHFLGRGISCLEEFQTYFEAISAQGFPALVDLFVDSQEYADYFGEETVPYLRGLGSEAQECRNWGPQLDLFKYSAPARKVPQFVTTFGQYQQPLPNQHPYGTGNDPLEIQFGAVFPQETRDPKSQPAHFSEDSRRILISSGAGNGHHDLSNSGNGRADLGRVPGSPEHHVLRWESVHNGNGKTAGSGKKPALSQLNVNLTHHSPEAVILATYRQVFGREVFDSQRQVIAETQLKGGYITLREFVRQLAKSRPFRRLYWEELYITKAIEYIHRRLLGRPTQGRREMADYYDICARQGFYAFVDALIDSAEYTEVFGEDVVPYERYLTPRGVAMRSPHGPVAPVRPRENPHTASEWMQSQLNPSTAKIPVMTSSETPKDASATQPDEASQSLEVHDGHSDNGNANADTKTPEKQPAEVAQGEEVNA
ncbi:phycobilisome rod-core linker polypeptide [Oscillatoria sp. CS-180]|uniref:phycobilisome rod-core linker polypeptide n=1 Tax=Oscillatoria sp. CS-180 TaxID=3021720 RepID=UPI00232E3BE0|nr:phycobilisome rod-core linker polypeptide [Oscillatoria sp. CS-180]MDB9526398.1 phycobilisome rod-core linker polypeptide [Oscillatoria sp. CS-180]